MPASFNAERLEYIEGMKEQERVYVHGDLNPDNIILGADGEVCLIDFADSLLAPAEYELPCIVCELFDFEQPFMEGYFGTEDKITISEMCLVGLLMHDFSSGIISHNLGKPENISTINTLRTILYKKMGITT